MILPKRRDSHWELGDSRFPYDQRFDGGGIYFAPFLLSYIKKLGKPLHSCVEVCAGLGFMGLSLLENKLIDNLILSDINDSVIDMVLYKPYIKSDLLDSVEGVHDLIIANLPYFSTTESFLAAGLQNKHIVDSTIYLDTDWKLHKKLFEQSHGSLNPNGLLIFFGEKSQLESMNYFDMHTTQYEKIAVVDAWLSRQIVILRKS